MIDACSAGCSWATYRWILRASQINCRQVGQWDSGTPEQTQR